MEKKILGVWEFPEGDINSLWVECSECGQVMPTEEAGRVCPSCKTEMLPFPEIKKSKQFDKIFV